MNGTDIYPLASEKHVVIPVSENHPKIVVTDGYHFTKPLELVFHHIHTYRFKVVCVIDDFQLMAAFAIILIFFMLGWASGWLAFKLVSALPIFYFLFLYYINRKDFIQIRAT